MKLGYIGVDLGGTKTEVIVLDDLSKALYRHRNATPRHEYSQILDNICVLIEGAETALGMKGLPVGVGIPGTISRKTGLIKNSNTVCLNGQPFQKDLECLLGRPIRVQNDANCLAVSEAVDGSGKNHEWVFAAILGTGCGAGIAHRQQALSGVNGIAGEWGHVPMPRVSDQDAQARPCYCGLSGCVETFLSGTGLVTTYQQLVSDGDAEGVSAECIARLAEQGDARAQRTLVMYKQHLLHGLAMIANILDPDIIVLGGGVSNIKNLYSYLNEHLASVTFGGENSTPIVAAAHGDSSGVRGAAWLNRPTDFY